jgi:23S rRNA (cytosine1962-C5)-methyltransferase
MSATLVLKPGRDKAIVHGHPWIFSGAIDQEPVKAGVGATVLVQDSTGTSLGWAAYSPHSQIRARVWTTDCTRPIDHAFFKRRVANALALRVERGLWTATAGGVRLLHGESDGLPGVTCDAYRDAGSGAGWLVLQLTSAGAEKWRDALLAALCEQTGFSNVIERSDSDVRRLEGLEERVGILRGDAPPAGFAIEENGFRLRVDMVGGHKTGFYLDQRANRRHVGILARGRRVLNCFCYTGGFSLAALQGGATEVLSIDASQDALNLAEQSMSLGGFEPARVEWRCDDVFQALRVLKADGRQFDLIVLDPPKLAPSAAHLERAARAYKDINLLAFRLLSPGGYLFTYSCSGAMSVDLFHKVVAGAAADASADAVIVERLAADADHPWRLCFPEGEYLKGLLLQKR